MPKRAPTNANRGRTTLFSDARRMTGFAPSQALGEFPSARSMGPKTVDRRRGHPLGLGTLGRRRRQSWAPQEQATFAKLWGVPPLDASSGKNDRHRLNHGGDRQANSALWHVVFTRMVSDPRTRHYIERRMKQGRTRRDTIRCLKGYVARGVHGTPEISTHP